MKKIGIDIRNIGKKRTGDEVVFFNLVKNLAQIDSQNEYWLFTDIVESEKISDIRTWLEIKNKINFKIISLKTRNRYTWNFWTLPRYLRKNPVNTYLTQYITPFFVPKKIKIATIVHDVSFKVYRQYIKKTDLFFLDLLIPLSFKRAAKIITVSKFTRDEILKYYKVAEKKVDWIQNAVSDNFHCEITEKKLNFTKNKYRLPKKFILYIGTLQPRKNIPTLIEAYAGLPNTIKKEVKLVLAGGKTHNYDLRIDKIIKKHSLKSDVFLPGFIAEEDKPSLFKLSYVFCNPSFYEGFGITVLEAMTLGIPSIISDIPPHQEIAGNSVFYFKPCDSATELTKALNSVLIEKDLRDELIQRGLEQAQRFSWKKTAENLTIIFKQLEN